MTHFVNPKEVGGELIAHLVNMTGAAATRSDCTGDVSVMRMEGRIEIDPMITHTMPLPGINKGFELMHESRASGASS
jgi:Zn-dependent alcohol dehydrogenase